MKKLLIILSLCLLGLFFMNQNKTTITFNEVSVNTYMAPANKAFNDDAFYNCVVDAYNSTNNKSVSSLTSLTDAQLATIKKLTCVENGISSVSGLEKLTELTELNLDNNEITSINLSKNSKLKILNLNYNNISSIDVKSNSALEYLFVSRNYLENLDISNNTKLIKVWTDHNNLKEIKIGTSPNLFDLNLQYNQLTNFNLGGSNNITTLALNNNKLTSLNLKNLNKLDYLVIKDNSFNETYGIYVYSSKDISKSYFLSLPDGYSHSYDYIDADVDNVDTTGEKLRIKEPGKYVISYDYYHNVQSFDNTFKGTHTVYAIEATSSIYDINHIYNYIYTGLESDYSEIIKNIKVNYGQILLNEKKLDIKYNNEVVKSFDIRNVGLNNLVSNKGKIYLEEGLTYDELKENLILRGVTFKVFDSTKEITSGKLTLDMVIKVYIDDREVDTISFTNEKPVVTPEGVGSSDDNNNNNSDDNNDNVSDEEKDEDNNLNNEDNDNNNENIKDELNPEQNAPKDDTVESPKTGISSVFIVLLLSLFATGVSYYFILKKQNAIKRI